MYCRMSCIKCITTKGIYNATLCASVERNRRKFIFRIDVKSMYAPSNERGQSKIDIPGPVIGDQLYLLTLLRYMRDFILVIF